MTTPRCDRRPPTDAAALATMSETESALPGTILDRVVEEETSDECVPLCESSSTAENQADLPPTSHSRAVDEETSEEDAALAQCSNTADERAQAPLRM
ncbi:hypothetical protein NUW54_g8255 [Trametes sanguinea]|uniref:Uncharacterized protein n=1 Tax=Trametes sanguinea TaxID=158606 RepID=A0ACC1PES3_9APHY|nr:hypothetical protein NUW54_g8255 [Trametes sanguinea]